MARRKNSRFRRGSGAYMCEACTRRTRETGKGESDLRLCLECYEGKPGDEVAVRCGKMTADEFIAKWGDAPARSVSELVARYQPQPQSTDPYKYASHLASMNID